MNLRCLQNYIRDEYFDRDSSRGLHATFTWLVEEVGELANAILNNDRDNIEEEIADVIAWTLSIANLLNVDVAKAFTKKYGGSKICIEKN
ncbi:MAG: nucleotide pyrophosphohydrolase [Sulfolobales archaeon]|nr:nucleotide pyrophosphohydrolase [Ignisphaera sp.]MCX8199799.1 nucleotide pyrophosphohydrolase [Sulfolobales archaeon]MDW8084962.1 MazG nucleotide pyrophosphohydrolase domain-containing protein [Ignisphaera sp.]